MLILDWMNGGWKINGPECRSDVHRIQNLWNQTDLRPVSHHFYLFSTLTVIGEKVLTSLRKRQERRNVRVGPMTKLKDKLTPFESMLMHGSAMRKISQSSTGLVQGGCCNLSRGINSHTNLPWTAVVEVARVLTDESTITAAELMAATEAARAATCLITGRKLEFDLDWLKKKKRRREDGRPRSEGRGKHAYMPHRTIRCDSCARACVSDRFLCSCCVSKPFLLLHMHYESYSTGSIPGVR